MAIQASTVTNDLFSTFDYISDPMTYEEMIYTYAESAGCTYEEAAFNFPKTKSLNTRATYRELTVSLDVATNYKAKIAFYCETSEAPPYWGILS